MKIKPILTAVAVALAAMAQPTWANFQFTQNEKGEVTHYNGIELPPIQTIEEAKAQAQKEIAAAKKAREAQQAEQPATRHSSPATPPQEVFFTGKPYLEETGQYLFLYRHYDPELARWTTADPSGFPDGANNHVYLGDPLTYIDFQGLQGEKVTTITDGSWWFSVKYKLKYSATQAPSLVGSPWLIGVTNLSGVPAGYELSISHGTLANISSSQNGNTVTWTGEMHATINLDVTFGVKIGPITLGPGYEDSVDIVSNWSVSANILE